MTRMMTVVRFLATLPVPSARWTVGHNQMASLQIPPSQVQLS